jgi:hypothetical protein
MLFVRLSEHFSLSDLHQIGNLSFLDDPDHRPVAAIPIQVKFDQNPFDLRKGGLTN